MTNLHHAEVPVTSSNPYMSTAPSWLFGFLGAFFQVRNAKKRGLTDTARYWKAATISTVGGIVVSFVASILMFALLFAALGNVSGPTNVDTANTNGPDVTSSQPSASPSQPPVDLVAKYADSAPKSLSDRLKVWNALPGVVLSEPNATSNEAITNVFRNWQLAYANQDPRYLWGVTEVLGTFYESNKTLNSVNYPDSLVTKGEGIPSNGSGMQFSADSYWVFHLVSGESITANWVLRYEKDHWAIDGRYSNPPT